MHSAGLWNVKLDERFKKLQHILPTNNCTIGHSIRHWLECYKIGKNSTKIPIIWYLATFWAPPPPTCVACAWENSRLKLWLWSHPPLSCLCMRELTSEVMVMVTHTPPCVACAWENSRLKLWLWSHSWSRGSSCSSFVIFALMFAEYPDNISIDCDVIKYKVKFQ